jgi:hypothetical protein
LGIAAGLIWIASGILAIVYQGEHEPGTTADYLVEGTFVAGVAVTSLLLLSVHSLQRDAVGRLGRAGVMAFIAASSVQVIATVASLAGARQLEVLVFPALLVLLVALVAYGASTWNAKRFPKWVAIGMMIALPVSVALGLYGGNILFGAFWIGVGFAPLTKAGGERG